MTARVEMILWPHFTTGTMEFRVDPGDPWTEVTLSAPLPMLDALDDFATQINALRSDTGEVLTFQWNGGGYENKVFIGDTAGTLELRLTPCIAYLLGFSSLTPVADDMSDLVPAGIAQLIVGRMIPREKEEREIEPISAGRALTYGYGRATRIDLTMTIDATRWETLGTSPLVGHSAVKVTWDNEDPYGEDDLDGYIIAYPTGTSSIENRGNGYPKRVMLDGCVMCDPGEQPFAGQGTTWANFWGAVRYGYSVQQWIQIEGISVLIGEWEGDAIAPSGYTLEAGDSDDPTRRNIGLILDETSRIGCALDEKTHFAKAFDQEYRLFATPTIDALFARPTQTATLAADVDHDDTAFPVNKTDGWDASGELYIGPSLEPYSGLTTASFTGLTRGSYGRARSWKKGTPIWNGPKDWKNRRVERFITLVDPSLRYVQGADVLSNAIMLGAGYVEKKPYRDGPTWRLDVRDQVRRLSQGLGVAASGAAKWTLDEDSLLLVDNNVVIAITVEHTEGGVGTTTEEEIQIQPLLKDLDGNPIANYLRRSQIMAYVVAAIDNERGIPGATFETSDIMISSDGLRASYMLRIPVITLTGTTKVAITTSLVSGSIDNWAMIVPLLNELGVGAPGEHFVGAGLFTILNFNTASVSVVLDEGNAADLPTQGFILLEGDGEAQHLSYIDLIVDDVDANTVNVILDPTSAATGDQVQGIARGVEGADISAKFYWRDSGRVPDMLRRAIVSTGDGVHGFYDTLPRGQGLALPYMDVASFPRVFDEHFTDLRGVVASEAGITLEELFSGILRLSQRGIVAGRSADGTECQIRAINTGSVEGFPAVTITDAMLVASGGKRPIRALSLYEAPQRIQVKCRTVAIGDKAEGDAVINAIQANLTDFSNIAWKLDVYGFARRDLIAPAKTWGLAWARSGENRQVLEIDIPPWFDIEAGSTIHLNVRDVQAFDYSVGAEGVDSLARVIGSQLSRSGLQTITVVLDGMLSPGPMSPSLPIYDFDGTGEAPTAIDFADPDPVTGESVYGLLVYASRRSRSTAASCASRSRPIRRRRPSR
jgi:hypothetical protein